jgi:hypothetical protein
MRHNHPDHVVVIKVATAAISNVATTGWNPLTHPTTSSLLNAVKALEEAETMAAAHTSIT